MILGLLLLLAAPSASQIAFEKASMGSRMPGETVSFEQVRRSGGALLNIQGLAHKVRVVVFLEPLDLELGLQRLAWWKLNHKGLSDVADLLLVSSASVLPKLPLPGLILLDDPQSILAARFGAIRPYNKRIGALPLAFVLDDSNIVRATINPAPAGTQFKALSKAVGILRGQLQTLRPSY